MSMYQKIARYTKNPKAGFSTVELSVILIVLVIVSFVVTAGQSLIKTAKLRALVIESEQYMIAYNMFISTYSALPGDMINASAYWPGASNGDGTRFIDWHKKGKEDLYVWQHLGLSNSVPKKYTGVAEKSKRVIGDNVPHASIEDGAWGMFYTKKASGYYKKTGNHLLLGAISSKHIDQGVLTSQQAMSIDEKIDDGSAYEGTVYTVRGKVDGSGGCTDKKMSAKAPVEYVLDDERLACMMVFWL